MSLLSTLRMRAGKSTLTDSLVAAAGIIAMESVRVAMPCCDLPYGTAARLAGCMPAGGRLCAATWAGRVQVLLRCREPKIALCSLQAGDQRLTDTRADEQERCITIKSTGAAVQIGCCLPEALALRSVPASAVLLLWPLWWPPDTCLHLCRHLPVLPDG